MYTVEFDADVKDGIIQIPTEYKELNNQHLRIIALTSSNNTQTKKFNPKDYFGIANTSKSDIDNYLAVTKSEWD